MDFSMSFDIFLECPSSLLHLMNSYSSSNISRPSSNTTFVKSESSTNTIHSCHLSQMLLLGVYMLPSLSPNLFEGRNKPYSPVFLICSMVDGGSKPKHTRPKQRNLKTNNSSRTSE
jgi:hypothetical protein